MKPLRSIRSPFTHRGVDNLETLDYEASDVGPTMKDFATIQVEDKWLVAMARTL